MPTPKRGQAHIEIAASPEHVYDLVSDIAQMGTWSPECYRCDWLDGATGPSVGACFRGHNRLGVIKWSTTSRVVAATRAREFAFTVIYDKDGRDMTRCGYQLEPSNAGSILSESFEFVWCPLPSRAL